MLSLTATWRDQGECVQCHPRAEKTMSDRVSVRVNRCKLDCKILNIFPVLPPRLCCFVPRSLAPVLAARRRLQFTYLRKYNEAICAALATMLGFAWVLGSDLGVASAEPWRVFGIKFLNFQVDAALGCCSEVYAGAVMEQGWVVQCCSFWPL